MPNKITALLQAPLDSKCEARECGKTDRHVFSPDALFLHKHPPPPGQHRNLCYPSFRYFFTEVKFTIGVVFDTV